MNKQTQADFRTASPFKTRYGTFIGGRFVPPVAGRCMDNIGPITAADIPLSVGHFRYFAGVLRGQKGAMSEIDHDTVACHFHEPLGAEAGDARARSGRIAKIAFTGSTATGCKIMKAATASLIPVTLERGRQVAQHLLFRAFNARCIARGKAIRQGGPRDMTTMVGAQALKMQHDKIVSCLQIAHCSVGATAPSSNVDSGVSRMSIGGHSTGGVGNPARLALSASGLESGNTPFPDCILGILGFSRH